ncbi:MAG: ABC transporter permease [Candidatus Limnocylindrales bacterium]
MSRLGSSLRQAWALLAIPVLAIFLSFLVGAVVIVLSSGLVGRGFDLGLPITAYAALLQGSILSPTGLVETFVQATPLLLAGLGVGFGFKAGLFNIGAQGQFLMGAVGAIWVGTVFEGGPAVVAIVAALIAGMIVGGAVGFVPGLLKATSGAHEVVTTIMMNYIALASLSWLVTGPLKLPGSPQPVTAQVTSAALPILVGRDGHLGILIGLAAVPILWFILYRTTRGFEIRTVGANPDAARYAGMKPRLVTVVVMTISGILAGLAGAGNVLGLNHQMSATFSTTVGFDSITVALLGRSNPWGILPASLLFGAMRAGAGLMQIQAGVPAELVDFIQAVILLFLVANSVLRRLFRLRGVQAELGTTETLSRSYGSEGVH